MGQGASADPVVEAPDDGSPKMKGWVVKEPTADIDALELSVHVPLPEPAEGQALIKVVCAGINPVDYKRMNFAAGKTVSGGDYSRDRIDDSPPCAFPAVIGVDGAGVVVKLGGGSDDSGVQVGDNVAFHLDLSKKHGSFAEYTVADVVTLCKIPPKITFAKAAAIPCAAWTAYLALFDKLRVEKGRSILINGGAGGVGSYAVQLCKYVGLYVIATCSTYNVDFLKSLGCDMVIDYTMDDVADVVRTATRGFGVDYVLETVSPKHGQQHAKLLRFGGALCMVAGMLPQLDEIFFTRQLSLHYVFLGGLHRHALTRPLFQQIGDAIMGLLAQGHITPATCEELPMEQAKEALKQLERGHSRGKLVLRVSAEQR